MKTLQKLGLAALLTLVGACSDEIAGTNLAKRNPKVNAKVTCSIDNHFVGQGTLPFTRAVDTDGDGRFEEAFVTKGYFIGQSNVTIYQNDNEITRATTHYVARGITEDKQFLTGFPQTVEMSPQYQEALDLACNGQDGRHPY